MSVHSWRSLAKTHEIWNIPYVRDLCTEDDDLEGTYNDLDGDTSEESDLDEDSLTHLRQSAANIQMQSF